MFSFARINQLSLAAVRSRLEAVIPKGVLAGMRRLELLT